MQHSSTLLCVLHVLTPFAFQHLKQNVRLAGAANTFYLWSVFGFGDQGVGMLSSLACLYTAMFFLAQEMGDDIRSESKTVHLAGAATSDPKGEAHRSCASAG